MTNFKNLLIAILTGLLALSLFTQPAQSASKAPDSVNLINYEACIKAQLDYLISSGQATFIKPFEDYYAVETWDPILACKIYLTKKP